MACPPATTEWTKTRRDRSGEEFQNFVFENVVPQRNEGRGAGVHDADAFDLTDLLEEFIEAFVVNRAAPEDIDVLGLEGLILREGCVDRVRVKAMRCDLPALEVLAENGGNQTLSDAALALENQMDLIAFRFYVFCSCHMNCLLIDQLLLNGERIEAESVRLFFLSLLANIAERVWPHRRLGLRFGVRIGSGVR